MPDILIANPDDHGAIERMVDQGDGTVARKVVVANSAPSTPMLGTDRSIVATTTPQTLMPARTGRARMMMKNDSAVDVWVNFGGTAAATPGSGNYRIRADGGYLDLVGYSGAVSIIAASATAAVSAMEL